jgi:hypothetical protein
MSLLSLLLLLGLASQQGYTIDPSLPDELVNGPILYQAQQSRRLDPNQLDRIESGGNLCFAMRSYIFKREDGNAPVLIGTITCTPGGIIRQRRVGQPKARLIPAD